MTFLHKPPKTKKKPKRPIKRQGKRGKAKADALKAIREKYLSEQCQWPSILCFGGVDLHHKVLRSQGGKDEPSNLIWLCRAHHSMAHTAFNMLERIRKSPANIENMEVFE